MLVSSSSSSSLPNLTDFRSSRSRTETFRAHGSERLRVRDLGASALPLTPPLAFASLTYSHPSQYLPTTLRLRLLWFPRRDRPQSRRSRLRPNGVSSLRSFHQYLVGGCAVLVSQSVLLISFEPLSDLVCPSQSLRVLVGSHLPGEVHRFGSTSSPLDPVRRCEHLLDLVSTSQPS